MSISSILNTGLKGMSATQAATQTTSSNIANAATVGYTRRTTDVTPDQTTSGKYNPRRVVEPFIQKRVLNAESGSGEAKASRATVDVLDKVFAEGDGSLGSALDSFQVSVQKLTAHPEDTASRQQVLSNANNLSTAFQNAAQSLHIAREDANAQVVAGVGQVNQRLQQIGKLGVQIQQAELNGGEASDMRDQRDVLLREVAKQVPISVLDQGNGQMTVLLGGSQQLVGSDGTVSELTTAKGDNGNLKIEKVAAGAKVDVTSLVSSGAMGGLMKTSATILTEGQQKLDQLAHDVATAYNGVHSQGYALDGTSGRNLFEAPAGVAGAAGSFAVSSDVAGQPENIAAASGSSSLPSDNRGALALSALSSAPFAFGGVTVSDALATLVGYAGSSVQNATQADSFSAGALEQVNALYENVSGVSSDEEMVSLMKYQRAYQASLKVIQTADQMLSDLLNIRG